MPIIPYRLEQRFKVCNLSQQQQANIKVLAENIQRVGGVASTYLFTVFDNNDPETLSNPHSAFAIFVTALAKRRGLRSVPEVTVKSLWQYYSQNIELDVNALLTITEKTFELYKNPSNDIFWHANFMNFEEAKVNRQSIMFGIYQGWLDFGEDFSTQIHQRYNSTLSLVVGVNSATMVSTIDLVREITLIVKDAKVESGIASSEGSTLSQGLFKKQVHRERRKYQKELAPNAVENGVHQRDVTRATSLFAKLHKEHSYVKMLECLMSEQDRLLKKDTPSSEQKKFLTTIQKLCSALVNQFSQDVSVSPEDKEQLQVWLHHQSLLYLGKLESALGNEHSRLKLYITDLFSKLAVNQGGTILNCGFMEVVQIKKYLDDTKDSALSESQHLLAPLLPILEAASKPSFCSGLMSVESRTAFSAGL